MENLIEPNIHPILVHFAYALTLTSVACYLLASFKPANRWRESLKPAADWMLAFGALAIIATIAAGFQAYYTVDHDTPSHAAMTTHRNWAVPSGIAVLLLAIWRWRKRAKMPSALFKTLFVAAALSLTVTAWWGGNIVFNYGLGVKSLPVVTGDGHDHDHGDTQMPAMDEVEHDNADGHHDTEPQMIAPKPHDNADGHHDISDETIVPAGHDNSDGHHDIQNTSQDDVIIRTIISDIQKGWEQGDGKPFRQHFLDFNGSRYFESGGENTGLDDLVENHVEPEKNSIPDLKLGLSNLQINYESGFAWAVADTTVQGTLVKSGTVLDRTGKQTWLFRKVGDEWKVVHTHSSSRAAKQ